MSEHLLILDGFAGDIAGKIVLLDDPAEAIIHAMRDGATFRLSLLASSVDGTVRFVLAAEPARQADGRDAEIARLVAEVERHRMTPEERAGVAWAAREAEEWANEKDDEHDQTHGERALALRAFLDRTAPKEVGRE